MGWKSSEDGASKAEAIRREKARKAANRRAIERRNRDAQMPHGSSMMRKMTTDMADRAAFRRREASKYQPISPLKVKPKK